MSDDAQTLVVGPGRGKMVQGPAGGPLTFKARSVQTGGRLMRQVRDSGDLPNLQAALATGAGPDPGASFEHGLGLLIAGIRARHAELLENRATAAALVEPG